MINPSPILHRLKFGGGGCILQTTKNELWLPTSQVIGTHHLVGLLGFWKNHIPRLGILLVSIYKITQEKAIFN